MNPTQYKLNVLLATADYIEQNPKDYNWGSPRTCNCGILATIINPDLVYSDDFTKLGSYTHAFNYPYFVCSTTGVYLNEVMQTLVNAGFTPKEIEEIEFTNVSPSKREQDFSYSEPDVVVKYFRKIAKDMQQSLLSQQTKLITPVSVSVSV